MASPVQPAKSRLSSPEFDRLDHLRAMFIDFDSFFASCEQQRDPGLRGRPVGVIPVDTENTCCIAASAEAKARGVRTGTPIREARRLCPGMRFVLAEHRVYIRLQQRALEAIDRCAPVWAVHSIDELSIKLCPRTRQPDEAIALGRAIKASLRKYLGEHIRCTVGIASNRFLAKAASNLGKPDGLLILDRQAVEERVLGLDVERLTGIGSNMGRRLRAHGIARVTDLYAATEKHLRDAWEGILGSMWFEQLRGGSDWYDRPTSRQSISHGHVMDPTLRTPDGARALALRLLTKACVRLRDADHHATSMHLSVRFEDGSKWKRERRFEPTQDSMLLQRVLMSAWTPPSPAPPKQVVVVLAGLEPSASVGCSLFDQANRAEHLSHVLDRITRRYGYDAIYPAGMHQARKAAPRRIAFGNIPDLHIPDAEV